MVSLGVEAMEMMTKNYVARSQAALKTAEYVIKANGLMTAYKDKYSQRSAFRAELRAYGWGDMKQK